MNWNTRTSYIVGALLSLPLLTGCQSALAEKSIAQRIADRNFPSVFQAWSPCESFPDEDAWKTVARHDLAWFSVRGIGLQWDHESVGLATTLSPDGIEKALAIRHRLLKDNPNIILIAEIRWRDAGPRWLPSDHKWWMRDKRRKRVPGWPEGGFFKLDYESPEFREHAATRAQAALGTGVFDGVLLDWAGSEPNVVVDIAQRIRQKVGGDHLILGNTNQHYHPALKGKINGVFMEVYTKALPSDEVRESLDKYEPDLLPPAVTCLEGWGDRDDLRRMRAYTTLALTHGNGYVLYGDPNPLPRPDHLHNWYDFWDADLGKPTGPYTVRDDGAYRRQFTKGTVIYNHQGNGPVRITFKKKRTRASTGQVGREFTVQDGDGDIFLKIGTKGTVWLWTPGRLLF